ncbi:PTS ascorbate transporter subunit IIC [bacterium]|nr:PTS ascorbate transporter subunit IIC [bacterium]
MDTNVLFGIVPRILPTFLLGGVALIGLLLQRKSVDEVISGAIKTMVGVLVLFAGVDILSDTIEPLSTLFAKVVPSPEGIYPVADWVGFLSLYGVEIVTIMVFGFLVNLLIARFTPLKFVFLTGHILFWNAFMVAGGLVQGGRLHGVVLVVLGSLILGVISAAFPALIAKYVFKITGTRDFSIGHTTTILSLIGAWIGKVFGDPSKSLEDVKLSKKWAFLKSMTVSTVLIMAILYIGLGFVAGVGDSAATFTNGVVWLWYFWALWKALLFAGGLTVLLTGVRMMLAEIIPAFHGLAQKVVPEAVPALDCPMIFPYGQNSLAIGFPVAVVFSMVTLAIFAVFGFPYLLLPLVVAAFFDVGPAVVIANAVGGRRGALMTAALGGVLLIVFQAISIPFSTNTTAGFINLFGGNDFSIIAILVGGLAKLLGF